MTAQMPTRSGDVVITHSAAAPSRYYLWFVEADQQQNVNGCGYTFTTRGLPAAVKTASVMAAETRCTVFLRELTTLTWTKLAMAEHSGSMTDVGKPGCARGRDLGPDTMLDAHSPS